MSPRDRILYIFLIWLCVYPGVLGVTYAFIWLGIDLPLWAEILISTAVTVPLISFVALPMIERAIARLNAETVAELKRDQARAAERG